MARVLFVIFLLGLMVLSLLDRDAKFWMHVLKQRRSIINKLHLQVSSVARKLRHKTLVMLLLLLLVCWWISLYWVLLIGFLGILVIWQPIQRLQRRFADQKKLMMLQFPIWLRQMQVLLNTQTVAMAIRLSVDQAPSLLVDELKRLVQAMEQAPLSFDHFRLFLADYELDEVRRAMQVLYRAHRIGDLSEGKELDRLIERSSKWLHTYRYRTHENRMLIQQWLGIVPLVMLSGVYMLLIFQVMSQMLKGGMT